MLQNDSIPPRFVRAKDHPVLSLRHMYPACGYLYILSNALWPPDVYKFGMTDNLRRRLYSYNSSNPTNVAVRAAYFCCDAKAVEDHLKHELRNHKVDEARREWVRLPLADLCALLQSLVAVDPGLSADLGVPVHALFGHDCRLQHFDEWQREDVKRRGRGVEPLYGEKDMTCVRAAAAAAPDPAAPVSASEERLVVAELFDQVRVVVLAEPSAVPLSFFVFDEAEMGALAAQIQEVAVHGRCASKEKRREVKAYAGKRRRNYRVGTEPKQSGTPGVFYARYDQNWVAKFYVRGVGGRRGKAITKCFSVRKWGDEQARTMALEYRTKMQEERAISVLASKKSQADPVAGGGDAAPAQ